MWSVSTWSHAVSLSPASLPETQLKPPRLQSPLSYQCPTIGLEKCCIIGRARPLWQLSCRTSPFLVLPSKVGLAGRIELLLLRLRILDLSSNFLTELPNEIENLSNLVQLRLGNNQLSILSPALGHLQRLEVLKFMSCVSVKMHVSLSDVGRQQ